MAPCTWCARDSTSRLRDLKRTELLKYLHHRALGLSFGERTRNQNCRECGDVFLTPAENIEHARTYERRFCFICNVEAYFPLEDLPDQYCRTPEQQREYRRSNAKSSLEAPRQGNAKNAAKSRISPFSTQHQNLKEAIQVARWIHITRVLEREGRLTVEQRESVNVKAAIPGQEADFLSDRDLGQLAKLVRVRIPHGIIPKCLR